MRSLPSAPGDPDAEAPSIYGRRRLSSTKNAAWKRDREKNYPLLLGSLLYEVSTLAAPNNRLVDISAANESRVEVNLPE